MASLTLFAKGNRHHNLPGVEAINGILRAGPIDVEIHLELFPALAGGGRTTTPRPSPAR